MIEVKNLSKSYGLVKAVKDVSFSVDSGRVVGILGPNGAGKTTTLNIMTGVLMPDEGEVLIDGTPLSKNLHETQKNIGYLAEDNPLYDNMLVSELLEFTAGIAGIASRSFKRALPRIVESAGIKDIYYRQISTLSKGLRQRVGIAQALLGDPKILILDEPTEGLDPNQRQEIRDLIVDMAKDRTVLMSTHVMQEVEAVCEEVIILNEGTVVATGRVDEITQAKEGVASYKVSFNKEAKKMATKLKKELGEDLQTDFQDTKGFVANVPRERRTEFLKKLSELAGEDVYLTELVGKQLELEEVFRRLTKGK